MSDIQQAREWAENGAVKVNSGEVIDEIAKAAVRVIQSLPNIVVDGEEIITIYDKYRDDAITLHEAFRAAVALAIPHLPTLAELIEADNDPAKYQWMQADHVEHGRVIITHPGDTFIYYMKQSGLSGGGSLSASGRITPLTDLPKLEWPGDGVVDAEIVEDEPTLPHPEDAPQPGEAWLVDHGDGQTVAILGKANPTDDEPTWFTDDGAGYSFDWAKPVSRLAPEVEL